MAIGARWNETDLAAYLARHKQPEVKQEDRPPSSSELHLKLPIPPSSNTMYDNAPGKGRVLTADARAFKGGAGLIARTRAREQGWYYTTGHRLEITLVLHFVDDRRDIDDAVKSVQDAVATALGFNDRVVDKLTVVRGEIAPSQPQCFMLICFYTSDRPKIGELFL